MGVFAVRTVKPCTEEYKETILKKRDNLTSKRRERRKRVAVKAKQIKTENKEKK